MNDTDAGTGDGQPPDWRSRVTWILLAVCLFGTYPLALIFPVTSGPSLVFYFILPTVFWFALSATACVLIDLLPALRAGAKTGIADACSAWPPQPRVLLALGAAATVLCAWSGFVQGTPGTIPVVEAIGFFTIPILLALGGLRGAPRRLPALLGCLWLVQVLHGLWQYHVGFEVVGLAGNRNWLATLVVATAPWAWLVARGWRAGNEARTATGAGDAPASASTCRSSTPDVEKGLPGGRRWELLLGLLLALVTLFLARQADSRATWLVLGAYIVCFVLLPRLRRLWRIVLAAAVGLALAAALLFSPQVPADIQDDIRLPLWTQTLKLIADHPLLGVGPGNFRREFAPYKSLTQKERRVAATVTEHPHNEPLHLAATLGLPLAALALLLWLPLLWLPGPGPWQRTLHFTAWMIFGHSLFDLTLVQPPTSLIGFLCLGLLWRERLARADSGHGNPSAGMADADRPKPGHQPVGQDVGVQASACPALKPAGGEAGVGRVLALVLVWGAIVLGLVAGVRRAGETWFIRQGWCYEAQGRYREAHAAYARAATFSPQDVQPHMLAGIMANNWLRQPGLALEDLSAVFALDPNYAHVNREIGAALGTLGQDAQAAPYFAREVQLYPFDPLALRQLLICRLATGDTAGLPALGARLPALDYRRAVRKLGEPQVKALARGFVEALASGDEARATAAARELTSPRVHEWVTEPAFFPLARSAGVSAEFAFAEFGPADFEYWRGLPTRRGITGDLDLGGWVQWFWTIERPAAAVRRGDSLELRLSPIEYCARTWILDGIVRQVLHKPGGVPVECSGMPSLQRLDCQERARAAAAKAGVPPPDVRLTLDLTGFPLPTPP